MSVGPQKCFLVLHTLKHGLAHKSTFWTLDFCTFVFQLNTHAPNSLPLQTTEYAISYTSSFWLVQGWGMSPVLPGLGQACTRFFTTVSLNSQSDNYEPQDARMMKEVGMVSPEGGKIAYLSISRTTS